MTGLGCMSWNQCDWVGISDWVEQVGISVTGLGWNQCDWVGISV